ncbi:Ku protein [Bradyrhizobium sp. AZCC 2289]
MLGEEVANEDIVKGYKVDTDTFIEVTKEELENVALESTRTIEIDEFVDGSEIDPRYLIRPYYLTPDGKVGHDAFAVIRETLREMNKLAIGRVVLTNREHIIALEPIDKGLMGTLLRYPYEVRSADEYFDDIQDVKVTKDMLDLARHIVNQKAGHFEPGKFEDQYETALIDLINQKRAGKPSCRSNGAPCPRWRGIPDPPLRFSAAFQLSAATPDASSAFASHGPSWRAYGLNIECASAGSTLPPLLAFRDWLIEEARRT